ncbi:MAG: hypothetical protein KIT27_02965 [Legionellales bacterium]|nr:hypothetical protein [Legionellales bacterium]
MLSNIYKLFGYKNSTNKNTLPKKELAKIKDAQKQQGIVIKPQTKNQSFDETSNQHFFNSFLFSVNKSLCSFSLKKFTLFFFLGALTSMTNKASATNTRGLPYLCYSNPNIPFNNTAICFNTIGSAIRPALENLKTYLQQNNFSDLSFVTPDTPGIVLENLKTFVCEFLNYTSNNLIQLKLNTAEQLSNNSPFVLDVINNTLAYFNKELHQQCELLGLTDNTSGYDVKEYILFGGGLSLAIGALLYIIKKYDSIGEGIANLLVAPLLNSQGLAAGRNGLILAYRYAMHR